jgi:UDP-perosamine 4-acetyltransferase
MKTVIIGAGGHARVVYEVLRYDKNIEVTAFVDNVTRGADEAIMNIPIVGDHSVIPRLLKDGIRAAIVGVGDNHIRADYFRKLASMGLELVKAIHPTAYIAYNAKIGEGTMVVAGSMIATSAKVGKNVIVNTGAIIEHEDILEDHVHIASGVVLAGRVTVGEQTFIGAGSIVKENITIGMNATVGAGSIVLADIPDNALAIGVPARVIEIKERTVVNE